MGKLWPQWSHCNCEGAGVFIHQPQSLRVTSGGYKFPSTLGLSPRQNDFLNDRESLEKQRTLGRQLECTRRVRSWGWRQALSAYLIQFSSVAQLCLTLCIPMNHSTPGLPVHQQLPESTQTHVHWVRDAIQPSHSLSSPSPPAVFPSIRVFSHESALRIRLPKYWNFSFNISPTNEHPGLISFINPLQTKVFYISSLIQRTAIE